MVATRARRRDKTTALRDREVASVENLARTTRECMRTSEAYGRVRAAGEQREIEEERYRSEGGRGVQGGKERTAARAQA